MYNSLKALHGMGALIAGICAGTDVLAKAGLLKGITVQLSVPLLQRGSLVEIRILTM